MTVDQLGPALSNLALAVIPPVGAIVVERFNPLSDRVIGGYVEKDLDRYDKVNHEALIIDATKMVAGAIELSGLAPTVVATITSAFAILSEFNEPFWPTVIYVSFFVILALVLFREIGGQTFLQLADTRQSRLNWTGTKVIQITIFCVNGVLILLILLSKWQLIARLAQQIL